MTTCKDCKFYKERHLDYNGWCRAHPPAWDKKFETCNFPTVMADYWCGEFAPIEPVSALDAENVHQLINRLIDSASLNPDYMAGGLRDWNSKVVKAQLALLAALGIDE